MNFTRQVVDITVLKHYDTYNISIPQREAVPSVSKVFREEVRLD
jgi:hypothetical protein